MDIQEKRKNDDKSVRDVVRLGQVRLVVLDVCKRLITELIEYETVKYTVSNKLTNDMKIDPGGIPEGIMSGGKKKERTS